MSLSIFWVGLNVEAEPYQYDYTLSLKNFNTIGWIYNHQWMQTQDSIESEDIWSNKMTVFQYLRRQNHTWSHYYVFLRVDVLPLRYMFPMYVLNKSRTRWLNYMPESYKRVY